MSLGVIGLIEFYKLNSSRTRYFLNILSATFFDPILLTRIFFGSRLPHSREKMGDKTDHFCYAQVKRLFYEHYLLILNRLSVRGNSVNYQ